MASFDDKHDDEIARTAQLAVLHNLVVLDIPDCRHIQEVTAWAQEKIWAVEKGNLVEAPSTYDSDVRRIDPPDCGCTDCMTGYSRPFNFASDDLLRMLARGQLRDASGQTAKGRE